MPELPEVETLRRQLARVVIGETIQKMVSLDEKIKPLRFGKGVPIADIRRWGKYLGLCFLDNTQIVIHLRMTGRLLLCEQHEHIPPHGRFVLTFGGGKIVCIDPRRFATVDLRSAFSLPSLIENPLVRMDTEALMRAAASRSTSIKQFLLDQRIVAGIGNIYACEVLFDTRINPFRKASSLTKARWQEIALSCPKILMKAVRRRGTSISDWRDLYGNKGGFQKCLRVYGRQGEDCPRCGAKIIREKMGGRGTFFCPMCQQ